MSAMGKKPALKQLQCPNCGTALSQYTPGAQTLVCPNCANYVAVGAGEPEITGKAGRLSKPPVPVEIGKMITIEGTSYLVMGRVMYMGWDDEDKWRWNEWLIGADDGRMLWLSYDEKGFSIYTKERFREQFDARTSPSLTLKGETIRIHERYPAKIIGAEGELTWQASEDEKLYVAEAAKGGKRYSIQQTLEEMEVYTGRGVSELEIARSFNDQAWIKKVESRTQRAGNMRMIAGLCIMFAITALILGGLVGVIGDNAQQMTVPLSPNSPSLIPVDFDHAGRPAVVNMSLNGSIPENNSIDIDVSMIAPDETESDLFSKSFWHETGRDEDGFWRDVRTSGSGMFVPLDTGSHQLKIAVETITFGGDMSANISIRRNIWVAQWFIGYAVLVSIIGVLFFMSAPSKQ